MTPSEIPLKMPQRGPSALGIGLYVALALCIAAPSRARADDVPSHDEDGLVLMGLGMTVVTSWIVFAVIDIDAASDHRPLSSEVATVEMLFPGMVSLIMGAAVIGTRASDFSGTALLAGAWFTIHGGYYALSERDGGAGEHSADAPAPKRTRSPSPRPGHFNLAFSADPHSPRAALSVTF